jgi:hypothetical protein
MKKAETKLQHELILTEDLAAFEAQIRLRPVIRDWHGFKRRVIDVTTRSALPPGPVNSWRRVILLAAAGYGQPCSCCVAFQSIPSLLNRAAQM